MRFPAIAALVFLSLLATACGSTRRLSENAPQRAYPVKLGLSAPAELAVALTRPQRSCTRASRLDSGRRTYVALLRRSVRVRSRPHIGAATTARLERRTRNGFLQVMDIIALRRGGDCRSSWYRVALPLLPNGRTGWIPAWTASVYTVQTQIVVDLSERRLQLFRRGRAIIQARVAVGAPATPTPTGRYYVNERYVLPDASGPFGPAALGISAHSDALAQVWVQDGPIGIHGTNEPWTVGHAASHGCIRLENAVMRRIFRLAPAGTPVAVHP